MRLEDMKSRDDAVSSADCLEPSVNNKHMRVVDCRPAYHKTFPQSTIEDIENQVSRLSLRFGLKGESADKLATLIAAEIAAENEKQYSNGKSKSMRGISRIEGTRTTSRQGTSRWYARVYHSKSSGKQLTIAKAFYDNKFGGKEAALCEAVKWRDKETSKKPGVQKVTRGLGATQMSVHDRKETVDSLLAKFGKVFIFVGSGPLAAERARLMGQSGNTLAAIRNGESNGFHLGQSTPRYKVVGFINEITTEVEEAIRLAVAVYKKRWMSDEDVEDAVSTCMLSYSSIDLNKTGENYITALVCCVVKKSTYRHYARNKRRNSLDENVEFEMWRQVNHNAS